MGVFNSYAAAPREARQSRFVDGSSCHQQVSSQSSSMMHMGWHAICGEHDANGPEIDVLNYGGCVADIFLSAGGYNCARASAGAPDQSKEHMPQGSKGPNN